MWRGPQGPCWSLVGCFILVGEGEAGTESEAESQADSQAEPLTEPKEESQQQPEVVEQGRVRQAWEVSPEGEEAKEEEVSGV